MRPIEQSVNATARDVSTLSRILQRVTRNETRDPVEKKKISDHLRGAMGLLMKWTDLDSIEVGTKNGKRMGVDKARPRAER